MVAEWITADLHLGHTNLRRKYRTQHKTTDGMDASIIGIINQTVLPGDRLYVVGDFSWRDPDAYAGRINAPIILVRGNHDPSRGKCESIFSEVHDIIFGRKIDGKRVTMCHYPMESWPHWEKGLMVHGHWHEDIQENRRPGRFNVGWDIWHRPIRIADMTGRCKRQ